jgi:hypothetical protein
LPNAPGNSEVFDGGPTGNLCPINCGALNAWIEPTGHYNEVNDSNKFVFYTKTFSAETGGPVFGSLLFTSIFINLKAVDYSPTFGPNSNSVAYTLLMGVAPMLGINDIGISQGTLPGLGTVGVMTVLGQEQIFTGWAQNILQ